MRQQFNGQCEDNYKITLVLSHAQHERGKVIGVGVHIYIILYVVVYQKKIESYLSDRLTFSNIRSKTQLYRLTSSTTAFSRNTFLVENQGFSLYNAHLALFVRMDDTITCTNISENIVNWN